MAEQKNDVQPAPRQRFQRRPPSAETLADLHEHNMMGCSAGFFCACWAAWLMGDTPMRVLSDFRYGGAGGHDFGPADAVVVVVVAAKLVFMRTCVARYILRPLVGARLPGASFEHRQRLTGALTLALMRLLSVCVGLWVAAPVLGGGSVWGGSPADASLGAKICVLLLAALQACDVVVLFAEGPPGTPFPMAKALLTLAVVAAAASVGAAPLAGAAVAVSDLPCLVAAVAAGGSGLLRWAARALLFVALWTCPPGLLYAAVSMGPRPAPADARSDTACRLLTAALSVLAMARMAAVLQHGRS